MVYFAHLFLSLGAILVSALGAASDGTCGDRCCPRIVVRGESYTFLHESEADAANKNGCKDNCVYLKDGGNGEPICFKPGTDPVTCNKCKPLPGLPKKYCQPSQECWPSSNDIETFRSNISGNAKSCLGLNRFVSVNDPTAHQKTCLPYTGLKPNDYKCKWPGTRPPTGSYMTPDPNCDPNPFVTGAHYDKDDDRKACMTPYQFLNNRNYKQEWMAAFIVTAETPSDIKLSVKFAKKHNLGISVMSTGHDMQDRNAGPGPNTLLVRTTCFREWKASLKDITIGNGVTWKDGYAVVGAGLSFGTNFWTNISNAEGTYALAAEKQREMVGGTCHSVGIVGWTLGGGRGWTAPKFGLGVDQLLHVDLIDATGNEMSANSSHNPDLFYAVRGGGGGFGIIYSIKIKLHKTSPLCTNMTNCYTMNQVKFEGVYNTTQHNTTKYVEKILKSYVDWALPHRPTWNSIVQFKYNNTLGQNKYIITIGANQFGHDNPNSFKTALANYTKDRILFNNSTGEKCSGEETGCEDVWQIKTDKYWCELFPDYKNGDNCTDAPWHLERWAQSIRFMVTKYDIKNDSYAFLTALIKSWQPACDKNPYGACASGYQIHGDLPAINSSNEKGVHDSGGPISAGFRGASFQVFNLGVNSEKVNLTFSQEEEWMQYTLGPALYPYSNASYFNEAEYTLEPGQWEERFWGKENHCKLLDYKMKYDQNFTFACRHCVGSEVGSEPRDYSITQT